MTDFPSIQWNDAGIAALGLAPICHIAIHNNEVEINVDLQSFEPCHFTSLVMRAYDTVRAAVDLLCFASGNGLTFLLESWTDPAGVTRPVAAQQPDLALLSTSVGNPTDFSDVLRIVTHGNLLFR
jgi:hypothetical protein